MNINFYNNQYFFPDWLMNTYNWLLSFSWAVFLVFHCIFFCFLGTAFSNSNLEKGNDLKIMPALQYFSVGEPESIEESVVLKDLSTPFKPIAQCQVKMTKKQKKDADSYLPYFSASMLSKGAKLKTNWYHYFK